MFGKEKAPKVDNGQLIENALNDAGFIQFLDKFEDRESFKLSNENASEVQERYERYMQVESVIEDVQEILSEEMSKDISTEDVNIGIDPSEIEGARDYVENLAVKDVSGFEKVVEDIETYKKLAESAAEIQKELDDRLTVNKERAKTLETAKGVDRVTTQIAYNREKKYIDKISKNRELVAFNDARRNLLSDAGKETGAFEIAKQKLADYLTKGLEGDDLDSLNKTEALFNKVEDNWSTPLDYTPAEGEGPGEGGGFDRSAFVKKLDESAQERVQKAVQEAVQKTPLGRRGDRNDQFTRFESALQPHIDRARLGTQSQSKAKEFVIDTLKEIYFEYTGIDNYQNPEKRAKGWMIQRILEKNGVKLVKLKREALKWQAGQELERIDADEKAAADRSAEEAPEDLGEEEAEEMDRRMEPTPDADLTEMDGQGAPIDNSEDIVDDAPHPADPAVVKKTAEEVTQTEPSIFGTPMVEQTKAEAPAQTLAPETEAVEPQTVESPAPESEAEPVVTPQPAVHEQAQEPATEKRTEETAEPVIMKEPKQEKFKPAPISSAVRRGHAPKVDGLDKAA